MQMACLLKLERIFMCFLPLKMSCVLLEVCEKIMYHGKFQVYKNTNLLHGHFYILFYLYGHCFIYTLSSSAS